jgi:precorrin-6Y C5,15-methyltransferase (decarboxylating)
MITVIGLDGSPLSPQAAEALAGATLVVGGRRHLDAAPVPAGVRTIVLGGLAGALQALAGHPGDAAVLASGDPGFFGIVRALRERHLECVVLPAASSVTLAFARAGLSWDDALVVSAHGRDLRPAVNACRAHPKVAVLTAPGAGPAELGAALAGLPRHLVVAERLGGTAERVTTCSPADAAGRTWGEPNLVVVLHRARLDSPRGWSWPRAAAPDGWALGEEGFDHRDSMVTKAEVRALALARLGPRLGTLVWDVGAGSGSVGVECARFGAAVVAVERDPRQCHRITANAARHGVDIQVVPGAAPGALDGLPAADAAFVGGGGLDVVAAVAARVPARVVVALAAVDRVGPTRAALAGAGYAVDGVLLQASRLAPLPGDAHRLAATNPVFLLWAQRAAQPERERRQGEWT